MKPDIGQLDFGQNTRIGHYKQEELSFNPSHRVLDVVQEVAEYIQLSDGSQVSASQLLNQFLFPPEMQYNVVGKLSGGERRRLQLLRMLMTNPNFIILDEPTNDLDIMTLNVLEDYLEKFDGCLLIVSHDRYFMDRLVEHLFVFKGKGIIKDFPGNYTDYRESIALEKKPQEKVKIEPVKQASKPKEKEKKAKLSFKEKQEYEGLEGEIEQLEVQKEGLVNKLNAGEGDFEELQTWSQQIEQINQQLEEKEMRWLELDERA